VAVGINLRGDCHMVVGCAWAVDWVWEASQFDGVGNGTDG